MMCIMLRACRRGSSTTQTAKESAERLKEKTKEAAGQTAEGLKNAAGSSTTSLAQLA